MTQLEEKDRVALQTQTTKQPVREPPIQIDLRKPRARWVRWIEWVAILAAFAVVAGVITYAATRDDGLPDRWTGDMIASQLRENHFPAPELEPRFTGDMLASELREGWAHVRDAVAYQQAPMPYWNSVESWNAFLAFDLAPTPYWSSLAAWNEFLAYEQAPPPYWSSVEAWNEFLEMSKD